MADYKRLIIDMAPELYEDLHRTADERGISVTELIRRAVALDRYIWTHRGSELLIKDGDGIRDVVWADAIVE